MGVKGEESHQTPQGAAHRHVSMMYSRSVRTWPRCLQIERGRERRGQTPVMRMKRNT